MTPHIRKVVYPVESLFPGGAEHALLRLATSLDLNRWKPEVWLLRGGGELLADFEQRGIAVRDCSAWDWNPLAQVVQTTAIRSALRLTLSRAHIVHSFAWDGCGTEAAAATLAVTSGYIVRIATAVPRGGARAWALKLCLADRVVVLSEFSKRQILAHYPGVERKLRVVPNGVDCEQFAPCCEARRAVRQSLGILPGDIAIACVARLFPDKNHAFLLHAFRKLLATENVAPRLLLVGEGGQRQRLVDLAAELGISDRVHFLGFRRDVARILSACDAFVLTSKSPDDGGIEGMSNATLEAMSVGLPVVMTRNGSEEILTSGQEGFVVDARDDRQLVAALAALCESAELRYAMGRAARARVKEHYNITATVSKNAEIYSELVDQTLCRVPLARMRRAICQWPRGRCSSNLNLH
jgi:Glycosyltransferase